MTEEALKEQFDLNPADKTTEEPNSEGKPEDKSTVESKDETPSGYMSREEWIAKGNDPDEFISPAQFKKNGELLARIKLLEDEKKASSMDFETRLQKLSKFHELELKQKVADLEDKFSRAVELADVDEAKKIRKDIDALSKDIEPETTNAPVQSGQYTAQDEQLIVKFNEENPWVMENTPKATYAQDRFAEALNARWTVAQAIAYTQQEVGKAFPDTNPNRNTAPPVDIGTKKTGRADKALTFEQLPIDAQQLYKKAGNMFSSKEEFVKTYNDKIRGQK